MEIDEARDFLREHHRAVLHTYRKDGSPQLSPILTVLDDDGHAMISTRETAVKVRNLARDPRASLVVVTDAFFGPWVRIDGEAEIVRRPEALDRLVDYYRRIGGEHPDWPEYRAAMEEERRVLVRIAIRDVGPDVAG